MIRNLKAVQVIPTTKAVQVIPTAKAVQVIPTAKAVQVIPTAKVVQVVPTAKVEANTWPSKFDPGSALTMMRSLEEAAVRWKDAMKCRSVVTKLILVDSSVVLFLKKWVSICLSFLSWGNALSLQLYCPEPDQEWHYICYLQHDWAYAWVRIWAPVLWIVAVPCLLIPTAPSVPWRTCASQDSFQCIVLRGPCLPAQFWSQKQDWTFIFIDLDFPCYTCFCQVATYRPNIHLNLAKTPGGGWLLFASFQTLLKSYLSVTCVRTSVTNAPWHTMAGFWCLLLWRLARTRRGIGFGKPRPWSNSAAPPKKRPSLQARTWWWLKTWTHQHSPALMWATYMERTNMPRSVVMRRRNCSRPPLILDMFQYFSKESLWHNTRLLFTCGWRLSRTLILAFPSASDPRMVWTLRTTLRCWWLTRPPWLETFLKVSLKCQGLPIPPWSTCQFSVMKVTKNGSTVTSSKSLPKSSFKTSWRSRVLQSALHGIEYILICVCVVGFDGQALKESMNLFMGILPSFYPGYLKKHRKSIWRQSLNHLCWSAVCGERPVLDIFLGIYGVFIEKCINIFGVSGEFLTPFHWITSVGWWWDLHGWAAWDWSQEMVGEGWLEGVCSGVSGTAPYGQNHCKGHAQKRDFAYYLIDSGEGTPKATGWCWLDKALGGWRVCSWANQDLYRADHQRQVPYRRQVSGFASACGVRWGALCPQFYWAPCALSYLCLFALAS